LGLHDCDFIPAEYHEQRRVQGLVRKHVASVLVVFAIWMVWVGAHRHRIQTAEAIMADISAQKSEFDVVAARKSEMERARGILKNLQDLMRELAGSRSLVTVFGELSRRIPDSIVLTECHLFEPSLSEYSVDAEGNGSMDVKGGFSQGRLVRQNRETSPEVVEVDVMRRGLTLVGVARTIPDVIDFAAALDKSQAFYEVDMDVRETTMYAGLPAHRFRMTCRIAQELERAR
jgi:Tfp pilus assembly protein PilN